MPSQTEGKDNPGFNNVKKDDTAYGGKSTPRGSLKSQSGNLPLGQTTPSSKYSTLKYDSKKEEAEKGNPPTQNEDGDDQEVGIMHLLSVYADKCSLNGVVFIKSSKYMVVKAIWSALLLGSLVAMVIHLLMLSDKYYSYEKQSKVNVKFESLKFPAVTICNVNAMRKSKSRLASKSLQNLIAEVNPKSVSSYVDTWNPRYEMLRMIHEGRARYPPLRRRWKRSEPSHKNMTWKTNTFFDDFNFTGADGTWTGDYSNEILCGYTRLTPSGWGLHIMGSRTQSEPLTDVFVARSGVTKFKGSWEAESQPSQFDKVAEQFVALFNQEKRSVRQDMGHQIKDMLIQCSFASRKCIQSNFTMVASSTMGNCYTIEYKKFIARKSGPREGLTLMLNLEKDEYVPGITNARGAKLVVHEPGTIPFPDDEGIAIGAGMETNIGLQRVSIQRLGEPHGKCADVDFFRRKYGIKYTRQTCQEICEMDAITKYCKCYNALKPFIFMLQRSLPKLTACQTAKESLWCMQGVIWTLEYNFACTCESPCKEVSYKTATSSKPWPSREFARLMAKTVCRKRPHVKLCRDCEKANFNPRPQFAKVNVYFETLNYDSVHEEPSYPQFKFMTDIGGTVGLYVGISALSAFEIVHLIIAILRYIFVRKFR